MAKYTELLAEYLQDNELPSKFSEIEGFEDMFKQRYCDSEIGFETEELFKLKLEDVTSTYFDMYKQRIQDLANAYTKAITPVKSVYTQADFGGRKSKRTDLPIDAEDVTPSSIDETEKATDNTNVQESGHNAQDSIALVRLLNEDVHVVINDLLDRYKTCFMNIY